MLFRLRCHFCGARSKSSRGTTEFQCQICEAWNFYNKKGEVVDTPARVAAPPSSQPAHLKPSQTFAVPGTHHHTFTASDSNDTFCQTCQTNQRIYTESLGNYLPDEDHPQYYEYEQKLPKYKADLEKRYPQICKKCAPKAQMSISKADRYGLQQNVAKNMADTAARAKKGRTNQGQRDDWGKWSMRAFLTVLGWMLYASLLVQVAWHTYAVLTTLFLGHEVEMMDPDSFGMDDYAFEPTLRDCATESISLRFHRPCLGMLGSLVPKALLTTLLLLWHNPGLAMWYHDTIRVEFVFGRSQYFFMQVISLFVRTIAYLNLSNASVTADFTKSQLLAAHGFLVIFLPLLQKYSERVIRFDAWRMKGKMMKSPDEVDVFGAFAGPEKDTTASQASSVPPLRLFERNDKPFPIENLAPRTTRSSANRNLPYQPPPSPPDSQSDDESGNQMDWQPSKQQYAPLDKTLRVRNTNNMNNNTYSFGMAPATRQPQGWSPMRQELFGIQSAQADADQRKRDEAEQAQLEQQRQASRSPFRGTLPQDPMQRRLRGPLPPREPEVPLTQRPEYFGTMSKSFGGERFGAKTPSKIGNLSRGGASSTVKRKKSVHFADDEPLGGGLGGLGLNDDDEDFSPVKRRHQSLSHRHHQPDDERPGSGSGSVQFKESSWRLPVNSDAMSTGLEDLFGGRSFRIADHEPTAADGSARGARGQKGVVSWPWGKILALAVPVVVLGVGWNVAPVRRTVCLWLVERLEAMGY